MLMLNIITLKLKLRDYKIYQNNLQIKQMSKIILYNKHQYIILINQRLRFYHILIKQLVFPRNMVEKTIPTYPEPEYITK